MADQDSPSREIPRRVVPTYTDGVRIAGVSSSIADGRKTVTNAGTAEQFPQIECRTAAITALSTNTGIVVVGASSVVAAAGSRRGTPLSASSSAVFAITDLSLLWIDATVSGEGVSYTVLA